MCVCLSHLSPARLFATPWTAARQSPLSMEFSRQEYWSIHALLQGIFQTQGLNPHLLHLLYWQAGSLPLAPLGCIAVQGGDNGLLGHLTKPGI